MSSGAGGCGFDRLPSHTKDFQMDCDGFLSLALSVVRLALRLSRWCQDKWTSRTGNLPVKRRDITEQLLKATLKHHENKKTIRCAISFYILYRYIKGCRTLIHDP